jgi:hypothetical protein
MSTPATVRFRNKELSNEDLTNAIKDIWENSKFPYMMSHAFEEDSTDAVTIKVYTSAFNKHLWVKDPVVVAYELTMALFDFLPTKLRLWDNILLFQTNETLVAPFIAGAEHIAKADKYITTYFSGQIELNPPIVNGWLVIKMQPVGLFEKKKHPLLPNQGFIINAETGEVREEGI